MSACAVLWVASLFQVFLRPVGSITSAYFGRQEWLVRCQGSSTTSSGPSRVYPSSCSTSCSLQVSICEVSGYSDWGCRVRWARPFFVAYCLCTATSSTSSGASGWIPACNNGHLKDLRAYVEYASRTITCSGVGGRIPADDNGALRDVAVVSVLGRLVYQRSAQRQWLRAWSTKRHWARGVHHRANGPSDKAQRPRGFDGCQRT